MFIYPKVFLLYMGNKVKKSKDLRLSHYTTKQGELTKEQYKVTLPAPMVRKLEWKKGDLLKIWINPKRHLELRKKETKE